MNTKLRQLAIKLRSEKMLSYSEIKRKLGVPKSTLSYWLREMPLNETKIKELQRIGWKKSEASRERFRNTMRQKRTIKEKEIYDKFCNQFKNLSNESVFVAGLMLYLSEGDKKNSSRIVLANTDPEVINFFIRWLTIYLSLSKSDVRIQLHLYEDMDLEKEEKFWQNILKLPNNQFYKSSVRKLRKSSFSYKDSIRHGTCSIYVLGVEKKLQLSMAIKALMNVCLLRK